MVLRKNYDSSWCVPSETCKGFAVSVCLSKKEKARKNKRWVNILFFGCFFLSYVTILCVIKCMSIHFHQCLVKCLWSSHAPPTTVPDSLLFIPCPCPSCCITCAEGFRCVCTSVRAYVCKRVCAGIACVRVCVCGEGGRAWACVCLREQKREGEECDGKMQRRIM